MATTARIDIENGNPVQAAQRLLAMLLDQEDIGAVMVPVHVQAGSPPMPTLVTDPAELDKADPFAPAYPLNSARMLARLTHGRSGEKLAAVLRPCEIRAFIELVKLNQGSMDEVVLVSMDCLGAYTNSDYAAFLGEDDPMQTTLGFLGKEGGAKPTAQSGYDVARACTVCEHPVAEAADINIGLFGVSMSDALPVTALSVRGEALLSKLGLTETREGAGDGNGRSKVLDQTVAERTAKRDEMFAEVSAKTDSLEGLAAHLAGCVNCYNCRAACPVCYCKECVFLTDVFDHKPWQYLGWAKQRGMLKMPTDTVFFHLTRMAHMSTACVGCGQCSNACPNGIEVMELFRTVAAKTQDGFGYVPGRSLDDAPPLSVFMENEFPEVAPAD